MSSCEQAFGVISSAAVGGLVGAGICAVILAIWALIDRL